MRAALVLAILIGCSKAGDAPPVAPEKPAVAVAPPPSSAPPPPATAAPAASSASAATSASAPAPPPIEKLSTTASTVGWKTLATKLGFSLQYPDKTFVATTNATGATLTSKLFVNGPHGIVEKGAKTEHRFSARFELRKEDVVAAMKRVVPYAAETGFPKGTVASFTPSEGFLFKTSVSGHDAYVVLFGAHGYDKRTYFVVIDAAQTLTVDVNVITDYLAPQMPKAAKLTEQEQIDIADALVLSLKL